MIVSGCSRPTVAPSFGYTLLDGSRHESTALRGKVVLVNFWATTCSVCVAEMPQLVALHQRYRARNFETLAVAMSYDPPARVAEYAETRQLPFGVAIDNTGAIAKAFGDIRGTPTSFLIDRQGVVAREWVGAPDFTQLGQDIDRLLAKA